MTDAVLTFKVETDVDGNVACIQALSGHPIFIGAAIDSIKTWKFRPLKVQGQRSALIGVLILSVSIAESGIKVRVLKATP
jgi:hypothetical protein